MKEYLKHIAKTFPVYNIYPPTDTNVFQFKVLPCRHYVDKFKIVDVNEQTVMMYFESCNQAEEVLDYIRTNYLLWV